MVRIAKNVKNIYTSMLKNVTGIKGKIITNY